MPAWIARVGILKCGFKLLIDKQVHLLTLCPGPARSHSTCRSTCALPIPSLTILPLIHAGTVRACLLGYIYTPLVFQEVICLLGRSYPPKPIRIRDRVVSLLLSISPLGLFTRASKALYCTSAQMWPDCIPRLSSLWCGIYVLIVNYYWLPLSYCNVFIV